MLNKQRLKKRSWSYLAGVGIISLSLLAAGCSDAADDGSVGSQVSYQIIGIDPGAGLMNQTAQVLVDYELTDWTLVESSGAAMAASLDTAYAAERPIIVTGWTPHWKFAKYDLKYLEDPLGTYGQDEQIHTIVRQGLSESAPSAYAMLERFHWTPDDMAVIMSAVADGENEAVASAQWIEDNPDKVEEWVDGLPREDGARLTLAYVAWDSEIASTNVVKLVLEERLGYQVTMLQVEAGPMWAGVAGGSADAMVAAWLPTTHEDYMNTFGDDVEDLGPNLIGTRLGLVVPAYMDIDSIEDLKN